MNDAALVILKPDLLAGPYAQCERALARDALRAFASVYGGDLGPYEVDTSARAAAWGLSNVERKVQARDWYVRTLRDPGPHLAALAGLVRGPLAGDGPVATADLVLDTARALGFRTAARSRTVCTHRDFLGLYADNTHFTRLAGSLRDYLVGKPIEVVLCDGGQELSALHVFKEMLRRVVRYPTTHYDAVENLLHVADPGSGDREYFLASAFADLGDPR
jgi:hypothetical protein